MKTSHQETNFKKKSPHINEALKHGKISDKDKQQFKQCLKRNTDLSIKYLMSKPANQKNQLVQVLIQSYRQISRNFLKKQSSILYVKGSRIQQAIRKSFIGQKSFIQNSKLQSSSSQQSLNRSNSTQADKNSSSRQDHQNDKISPTVNLSQIQAAMRIVQDRILLLNQNNSMTNIQQFNFSELFFYNHQFQLFQSISRNILTQIYDKNQKITQLEQNLLEMQAQQQMMTNNIKGRQKYWSKQYKQLVDKIQLLEDQIIKLTSKVKQCQDKIKNKQNNYQGQQQEQNYGQNQDQLMGMLCRSKSDAPQTKANKTLKKQDRIQNQNQYLIYFSQSKIFDIQKMFQISSKMQNNNNKTNGTNRTNVNNNNGLTLITKQIEKFLFKKINKIKLLFRYQIDNPSINPHNFIMGKQMLFLIAKIKQNGRIIGGFSDCGITKNQMLAKGFIFSFSEDYLYKIPPNQNTQPNIYHQSDRYRKKSVTPLDNYHLIFGNSDIRIKIGSNVLYSNFGFETSYFKTNQRMKISDLLDSEDKRQVQLENYELYQVVLNL